MVTGRWSGSANRAPGSGCGLATETAERSPSCAILSFSLSLGPSHLSLSLNDSPVNGLILARTKRSAREPSPSHGGRRGGGPVPVPVPSSPSSWRWCGSGTRPPPPRRASLLTPALSGRVAAGGPVPAPGGGGVWAASQCSQCSAGIYKILFKQIVLHIQKAAKPLFPKPLLI